MYYDHVLYLHFKWFSRVDLQLINVFFSTLNIQIPAHKNVPQSYFCHFYSLVVFLSSLLCLQNF